MYRYVALTCFLLISLCIYMMTGENFKTKTLIELKVFSNITVKTSDGFAKKNEAVVVGKTKNVHVPKFMLELYESNVKNQGMNYTSFPEVVRSVIPKSADVFGEFQDNHLLTFEVPTANVDEVFLSAELKILTLVDVDFNTLTGVERLVKISAFDENVQEFVFLDKLRLFVSNNTWITFNLTNSVHGILNSSNTSRFLKLVVFIEHFHLQNFPDTSSKSFRLSLMPIVDHHEHDYPVLLLSYNVVPKTKIGEAMGRAKRSIEEDYEEESNRIWDEDAYKKRAMKKSRNGCKKKPLYVNFAEINYDSWIVQPSGYEAYQCQGKCFYPVAEHLSPTKHAILQALLHNLAPGKASRSCCVPTKLGSISLLYIDHNGILTYRFAYQDMVAIECGCR